MSRLQWSQPRRWMGAGAVFFALALPGLSPPSAGAAEAQAPAAEIQPLVERTGQMVNRLRQFQAATAVRPLTVAEVIDRVGRDPEALCRWVHERIAYEPYRGFLKGARGALISGRANSGDQSLLLAELLRRAGYKVQLARGPWPADAAKPAMGKLPEPPPQPDKQKLAEYASQSGLPMDRIRAMVHAGSIARQATDERLWNRTLTDLNTLGGLLDAAKIPLPPRTAATGPKDHWWVRAGGRAFDPVLNVAPKGRDAGAYDLDQLPADAFAQFTVRIMIRSGQEPINVLEAHRRTADLFGRVITLANVPLDVSSKIAAVTEPSAANLIEALASATKFQPVLMISGDGAQGEQSVAGKGFDLSGRTFDAGAGRIEAVKKLGGAAGGFGGLLGGGARTQPPKAELADAWIELGFTWPGQAQPVLLRRELLMPQAHPSARQKVLNLIAVRRILLLPEDMSGGYVTDRMLDAVQGWGAYLSRHTQAQLSRIDPADYEDQPTFDSTLYAFGLARRHALEQLCRGGFGATNYAHAGPTAVSDVSRFVEGEAPKALRSIDILRNEIVPAGPADPAAKSPQAGWAGQFAFACGVMDTALEHELLADGSSHQNASVALERLRLMNETPAVGNGTLPPSVKPAAAAMALLKPDLKDSAFIFIPGQPLAWYRVRLADGSTLGFTESAGGGELAEYAEQASVMLQVKGIVGFYGNLGQCLGAAIAGPLAGQHDWRKNLKTCFTTACGQVEGMVGGLVGINTGNWTNLITQQTVSHLWGGICNGLWNKLAK